MSSRFGRLSQKINVIQSLIIYNGNILHDPLSKPANVEYSSTLIFYYLLDFLTKNHSK